MENKKEIFKDIDGFENLYQISNLGNVKSLKRFVNGKNGGKVPVRERIMKQGKNHSGYKNATLSKEYVVKYFSIQRLVAIVFIPNPENKPQVNHKNGIVDDNRVENLEWCTASENNLHAFRELKRKPNTPWLGKSGKNHHRSKHIYQYDLNGNLINEFESAHLAAKHNNIRQSGISGCANGTYQTSSGFKWSYNKLSTKAFYKP
jgi:hypothetical protein